MFFFFHFSLQICIPPEALCDGWDHCADHSDESEEICSSLPNKRVTPTTDNKALYLCIFGVVLFVCIYIFACVCRSQMCGAKLASAGINEPKDDHAMDPLSPPTHKQTHVPKITSVSDNVRMSTLNSRSTAPNSYDRNNITGASSSTTNGSLACPLGPPPSPETTVANSYRPYNRHYKKVNEAPPPSPYSTDLESDFFSGHSVVARARSPLSSSCEPNDYRNILRSTGNTTGSINSLRKQRRYDPEPCPPPPTPRSSTHRPHGSLSNQ